MRHLLHAYSDPRLLDCSHKFCLKCLQELAETQGKEDETIRCPICREGTDIPQGGVQALPHSSGDQVKCQACEKANPAVSKCLDCNYYLCLECQVAHQRWAQLRTHRIANLTEFGPGGQLKSQYKCQHHPEKDVCFYCNTCEVLICDECTASRHNKSVHSCDDLKLAMKKHRHEVDELVSKVEKNIKDFLSANPYPEESQKRLSKMLAKTKIQISLKAEKEIAKIRQQEEQLKLEAEDRVAKKDKEFKFATTARKALSNVSKVMKSSSSHHILETKKNQLRELKAHVNLKKAVHKESFLALHESEVNGEIGNLVQEEKWERKSEVSFGDVKHLAVFVSSDVAISNTSALTIWNLKGEVLAKKTSEKTTSDPKQVQNPTNLAVSNSDDLIVLDSPMVKTFDKELKLLHHFTPGKEADIDGSPSCLTVTDSNLIAVGYKGKDQISLHNSDGFIIRKVAAPMIDEHLATDNQHLLYINESSHRMIAVDFKGKELFNVWGENWTPRALCCDAGGDIYVSTGKVIQHCRKTNGQFILSWNVIVCDSGYCWDSFEGHAIAFSPPVHCS